MGIKKTVFAIGSILLLIASCQKKEVQLPLIDIPGISEIQNHSSIWVFMESKNGEIVADLNKNNKILNTHWIYNIDKRLPMKEVVPVLIAMQENKNKDSMHKKEGMKSYFSYADTKSNSISLLLFPATVFITDTNGAKDLEEFRDSPCIVTIELVENNIKIDGVRQSLDDLKPYLKKRGNCPDEGIHKVMLIYNDQTSYQSYLELKVYLDAHDIPCGSVEYFHTVK